MTYQVPELIRKITDNTIRLLRTPESQEYLDYNLDAADWHISNKLETVLHGLDTEKKGHRHLIEELKDSDYFKNELYRFLADTDITGLTASDHHQDIRNIIQDVINQL